MFTVSLHVNETNAFKKRTNDLGGPRSRVAYVPSTREQYTGRTCWRGPCLVRPSAESRHGGLYVLLLFLAFVYSTIPVRQVVSNSTRPISANLSGLVELWQYMTDLKLVFFDPSRDVPTTINFCWFYPQNWFSSSQWLVARRDGITLGFGMHLV